MKYSSENEFVEDATRSMEREDETNVYCTRHYRSASRKSIARRGKPLWPVGWGVLWRKRNCQTVDFCKEKPSWLRPLSGIHRYRPHNVSAVTGTISRGSQVEAPSPARMHQSYIRDVCSPSSYTGECWVSLPLTEWDGLAWEWFLRDQPETFD